jgi:hypothetical protein
MNCIFHPPANPNETAPPSIPVAKPDYASSEVELRHDGRFWVRTGLCIKCNAAIYGARILGAEIDVSVPLHHAIAA